MEEAKNRRSTVSLCGLPPIEQKTLDKWGTRRSHSSDKNKDVRWMRYLHPISCRYLS